VIEYTRVFDTCVELMETIQQVPQPVIAQVHAPATAAGCQLVATSDLAVAADTAWFATPGVKIGLFCSTPMVALTRAIGRKKGLDSRPPGERVPAGGAGGGVDQQSRPRRTARGSRSLARGQNRRDEPGDRRAGQGRVLPSDRYVAAHRVQVHQRGHGVERAD